MSWQTDLFFQMHRRNGQKVSDAMLSAFADALVRTESFLPVGGAESIGDLVKRQSETIAEMQSKIAGLESENTSLRGQVEAIRAQRTKGV
jgi:hypothetical protein